MALSRITELALANQLTGQIPDIVGGFEKAMASRRDEQKRAAQVQSKALQGRILQGGLVGGSDLSQLAGADPAAAQELMKALNITTPGRLIQFGEEVQQARSIAQTDPGAALSFIIQARDAKTLQGVKTDQMDQFIIDMQVNPQESFAILDQIGRGFENARVVELSQITLKEQARQLATDKRTEGDRVRGLEQQGRIELAQEKSRLRKEEAEANSSKLFRGSTEILGDGTTITVTAKGPEVFGADGLKLEGQAAKDAVLAGRAKKVQDQIAAAGGKREATLLQELELKAKVEAGITNAKNAANSSIKAFDSLGKVRQNMANLDEAIEAIDNGANTGFVQQFLPSIRTASVELKNVRNRLGLDVIGDVTFGALSKGELDLALNTAIPTGLDEIELRAWLVRKKQAQEVYSDYLHAAGVFLGTSGNTVAQWQTKNKNSGMGRVNSLRKQLPSEGNIEGDEADFEDGVTFRFEEGRWRLVQ